MDLPQDPQEFRRQLEELVAARQEEARGEGEVVGLVGRVEGEVRRLEGEGGEHTAI